MGEGVGDSLLWEKHLGGFAHTHYIREWMIVWRQQNGLIESRKQTLARVLINLYVAVE